MSSIGIKSGYSSQQAKLSKSGGAAQSERMDSDRVSPVSCKAQVNEWEPNGEMTCVKGERPLQLVSEDVLRAVKLSGGGR